MPEKPDGTHGVVPSLGLPIPTTHGDVGAVGIGLAAGYFGGLLLVSHFPQLGATPGAVSVYTSTAALGIKNLVQAALKVRRANSTSGIHPKVRAANLLKALDRELGVDIVPETAEVARLRKILEGDRRLLVEVIEMYGEGLVAPAGLDVAVNSYLTDLMDAKRARREALRYAARQPQSDALASSLQASLDAVIERQKHLRKQAAPSSESLPPDTKPPEV